MKPKIGDIAPDFSATATDGQILRLSDYAGKTLVLYFYPMDDTPGCTAQACSLRDHNAEIRALGAEILGVSTQDEASHQGFTQKYQLNFPLLADTDGAVARAYGAIGEGGLVSKISGMLGYASRVTFIIDPQGKIAQVIDKPNCGQHAEEVLAFLQPAA
jgi:peroxiredoxin Q/BCP